MTVTDNANMDGLGMTIELMNSGDYKDRFIAEYRQTMIRASKLRDMIDRYEKGNLDFDPSCPIYLLKRQYYAMVTYLEILEKRADIEGISI